jgi:hypothetical protein
MYTVDVEKNGIPSHTLLTKFWHWILHVNQCFLVMFSWNFQDSMEYFAGKAFLEFNCADIQGRQKNS